MKNKHSRFLTKKRVLWLLGGIIIVVMLLCIFLKERVASIALSLALSARYTQTVKESYSTMNKELESPLEVLGFQVDLVTGSGCGYDDGFQVFRCSKMARGKTAVVDDAYVRSYSDEIKNLEQAVSKNHWTVSAHSIDGLSLVELINPETAPHTFGYRGDTLYHGVIVYEKNIDGFNCSLDISRFDYLFGVLSCSKTFDPF